MYVKEQIGTQKNETVKMSRVIENECYVDGKEPVTPISFTKQDKCIWEYNILGLWSIGECLVENDDCSDIVCIIIVVALIILIGLIVFTQKHRANKRKRLEGSLVRNEGTEV